MRKKTLFVVIKSRITDQICRTLNAVGGVINESYLNSYSNIFTDEIIEIIKKHRRGKK